MFGPISIYARNKFFFPQNQETFKNLSKASLAQLVERSPCKRKVVCSIQTRSSLLKPLIAQLDRASHF